MSEIAIVATLKPDAEDKAARLLEQGPPFDLGVHGFDRHMVFLSANEVVFLFGGAEVEWRLDDLVDGVPGLAGSGAFEAWRPLVDGAPRLARVVYAWQRPADRNPARPAP